MILKTPPSLKELSLNSYLFSDESVKLYEEYIQKTFSYIERFLSNRTFYKGDELAEILKNKEQAKLINIEETQAIDSVLEELNNLYIKNAIAFHNPTYVAHLNCPITLPSIVAEMIATTINTAVETWDQSTSATFIEEEVIQWTSKVFNMSDNSDGVFTSGGTQSNFMAMLMARDDYAFKHFGINIKQHGWSNEISKFRIFCSEKAHFSIQKSAALLGMGYDAVIPVRVDERMQMDTNELVLAIEKTKQEDNIPIAIVATLGTTDYGSFDSIKIIGKIAKENQMWLHADGAYGGAYALTNTHKEYFNGIEMVNSITVDFHKTLFQPVSCSAFLVNNKQYFKYVSYYADYLNPIEEKDSQRPNLIEKSIQTTRRFDALKVWLTLKTLGTKTIANYLEEVHYLAKNVYLEIKDKDCFETVHEPELSTLVFRYKAQGIKENRIHDAINLYIKNTLYKAGKASIASTKLNGNIYLKFTLLNPKNTINNLLYIIEMIQTTGEQYKITN
ncbi:MULTISPECIES: pyridoxal phosphate-dependent decarboxylase family protein [Tenacibaculum]|uniref:Aspartate aminotransferase family protein n=1 Tax=Tenacibaculum mesophilum TaxID=104268 RepID=A0AAE9MPI0_9FLAO|nr:aspartate aminotransferase family protein [Tenacibaculum mesophilum]GFD71687.1 decarboxylase [Tenacibaculum sp. KUL113]GFD78613.1 decarboxylase [Tenacibaculum sp. KUL118]GFD99213.1 decarboxylase [Alteromonas sp. KUL156]AZJ33135.1 aspartate aminotransferase family protein [Tenacibaculum mesophilum]KAF9659379.1 aspartate aminotransferase family protein [Tenacibaculum mesophilum]